MGLTFKKKTNFLPFKLPRRTTMPEGPEVAAMARFINTFAADKLFKAIGTSKITKNPALSSKNLGDAPHSAFRIAAASRGKELRVDVLESKAGARPQFSLLVQPGMTGHFLAGCRREKHCHLWFTSTTSTSAGAKGGDGKLVDEYLQFVDPRRFGRWKIVLPTAGQSLWSPDRGPDPVTETAAFRKHVQASAQSGAISPNAPICEVLLDQRFFNGVGNIYRAEALHRAHMDPFLAAGKALSGAGCSNLLTAVTTVMRESVERQFTYLSELKKKDDDTEWKQFNEWLRVYGKGNSAKDRQGRTVWFSGGDDSQAERNAKQQHKPSDQIPKLSKTEPRKRPRDSD